MAEKKIYIGSMGPFIFDDSEAIDDPDGDFSGEDQIAFRADEKLKAPAFEGLLVSGQAVTDIDDPSTELNALTGDGNTSLLVCYEASAGVPDEFTIYLWDSDAGAENVPYTVDGSSGLWIAIGGKYFNGDIDFEGEITTDRGFRYSFMLGA